MRSRRWVLGAAVLALAALNVWHWTSPGGAARSRPSAAAAGLRPDDLQLRVAVAVAGVEASPRGRHLFEPRVPRPAAVVKKVIAPEPPPPPPPGPPPRTAEELAEDAARAELKQIKLVGVVFRGNKGQAFLVKGDQLYMVSQGGRVGERFEVEAIRPDGIQLKDPASRVNGQIPVSGK